MLGEMIVLYRLYMSVSINTPKVMSKRQMVKYEGEKAGGMVRGAIYIVAGGEEKHVMTGL